MAKTRDSRGDKPSPNWRQAVLAALQSPDAKRLERALFDTKTFNDRFWADVTAYRNEMLENAANGGHDDERPMLSGLEEAWEILEDYYQTDFDRDYRGEVRAADNPLAAFFFLVDFGFYPPPELLLALLDRWETYLMYQGHRTLEDVFFGTPKRKAGNYAARRTRGLSRMRIKFRFAELLYRGATRERAAETISEEIGGKLSPESILRYMAGFSGWTRRPQPDDDR